MKKRWIVIPVVAGLTALVVTGGAIFAHGNGAGPGGKAGQVTERAAEILGIEPTVLQDAFRQAIKEQHEAAPTERLAQLVENERITQEESDAILAWYQAKPDAADQVPEIMSQSEEWVQRVLVYMVGNEQLTQAEANEVLAWVQARPAALQDLPGFNRGRARGHFQGHFRGSFQGRMMPGMSGMPGMKFERRGGSNDSVLQQSYREYVPALTTDSVLQ